MNIQEKYNISILGTPYKVFFRSVNDDVLLNSADGYMDKSVKHIVIADKAHDCELKDFEAYQKAVLRHEIIHAFFEESGLSTCVENKSYGVMETYVDWFAIQAPKIYAVFKQLNII